MSIADRIVVLRDGRLVQQGAPSEVYERPRDLQVAQFLGIGPVVSAEPGERAQSALFGGRNLIPAEEFDTSHVAHVVVPISAVHSAERCGASSGEAVLAAIIGEAAYEGGSWLISARLTGSGDEIQFRSERALPGGLEMPLHLVLDRVLPFAADGSLCPAAGKQPSASRDEVSVV